MFSFDFDWAVVQCSSCADNNSELVYKEVESKTAELLILQLRRLKNYVAFFLERQEQLRSRETPIIRHRAMTSQIQWISIYKG